MSKDAVLRAMLERAGSAAEYARGPLWTGVKTGAGGLARAPIMGTSGSAWWTPSGIGSDRVAARNYSGSGYGDSNSIGSRISADLQRDFGLTPSQAAGVVGNLGHESGGFKHYQEISPTSGRGGAGWAQWTGPRRVAFENYTRANNLNPQSYEANYGFLKTELSGSEKGALAALRKANTVQEAVYAFERQFERAGVKNYGSRIQYANSLGAGAANTRVADLQRNLNAAGAGIAVDGIMGPQTRAAMAKYPDTALAYTSTGTTAALQAAAGLASGRGGSTSYQRGSQVAAMQRDLNARGANLTVDGIRGPLTMAAEKQFLGSPTSVRTGGFTNTPAQRSATPQTPSFMNPYSSPTTPYTSGRPSYVPTPSFTAPREVSAGVGTPRTPYLNNPYTSSTGGANALQPTRVPTSAIKASPYGGTQLPSYSSNITYPSAVQPGARAVPTTAVPYGPRTAPVGTVGTFNRPAIQTPSIHQPYTMSPYANSTGGANAIQAPRIPQARPAYPLPPVVTAPAGPTLMQSLQDQMQRAAAVAAQVGGQFRDAYRESTRSGMGYSGGAGGGYRGGTYGGAAGRSINTGVGGAFRNR